MMEFSVLMVTYGKDHPEHLSQALRSVSLDQTLLPTEIVLVVNGALNPDLEQVIDQWSIQLVNIVFRVVRLPVNGGLGHALNRGAEECTTNWIARMDADDISLPNRFLWQCQYLLDHPSLVLLGGAIEILEESNGHRTHFYPENEAAIRDFIVRGSPFAHPSIMIRRDILLRYRYQSQSFHAKSGSGNEDIELWFRLVQDRWPMGNLDQVILRFRVNDRFYSRRSHSKAWTEMIIYLRGIRALYGWDRRLIFPVLRWLTRLMPQGVNRVLYRYRNALYRM